ncbi:MAG: nucleotidyltransferase family protein, partial [Dermatophilaceae bacterium]
MRGLRTWGSVPAPLTGRRWRRAVGAVRLAVSEEGARGGLSFEVPVHDLAAAAELHGVEGWVRRKVGPGNPGLDRAVHAALGRHQRAVVDLQLAAGALDAAMIAFLIVKGPALVTTCYSAPDLRSYVDLDVLVEPRNLGGAVSALQAAGFVVFDVNWPMLTAARVHELRLISPAGGVVDLHWALAADSSGQYTPRAETLMARSVPVDIGGVRVRTLCPADTLVHLAVHTAGSGGHRLIWLADIRGALARAGDDIESGELGQVIDEWRAKPALGLVLARTHRLLGVELPDQLRRLVRPGAWSALVRVADWLSPAELSGTGGSLSRLVARSCRASPAESLRAAMHKSWVWWRGERRGPLTPEELCNPDDPTSSVYPAGGSGAAEQFYAQVAASFG